MDARSGSERTPSRPITPPRDRVRVRRSPLGRPVHRLLIRGAIPVLTTLLWPLPWRLVLVLGRGAGTVLYLAQRGRRARALEHLERALGDTLDAAARRRTARGVFRSLTANLAEACWAAGRPERVGRIVTFQGLEHMEAARAGGRGVVLLTGHLGSWELMAAALVRAGFPMSAIAREVPDRRAGRFVVDLRARFGVRSVLRGSLGAAREILRTLRAGEVLGALIDQDIRAAGIHVPFFGRPAFTPTGPLTLAMRAGAAVVPGATWRTEDGRHRVRLDPPLVPTAGVGGDEAVAELAGAFTAWLEERIREHPEQWVWTHRRWRRTERQAPRGPAPAGKEAS